MKQHVINKTMDMLCKVFSLIGTAVTKRMVHGAEIGLKSNPPDLPLLSMENVSEESPYLKQLRHFLIKDEKVAGKPLKKKTPEIRIVYVDNFTGAFIYFLRLCDQRLLTYQLTDGHLYCLAEFPDGSGKLSFSDKVKCRNKSVVALLKIEVPALKPEICEIRFEVK